MLKNFSSLERFATFANDRVTPPTHAERWKNDYGRLATFPKKSENARRALAKTSWCDGSFMQKPTNRPRNKKAVLSQGNRAMPQLFFSV